MTLERLATEILNGSSRAIAKGITLVEQGGKEAELLLKRIHSRRGKAHFIGFTGPPGSGKSTLVDRVAVEFRRRGFTVAILAIDPTSPFSGGAILGDRVRMSEIGEDPSVFMRSMATRGAIGGLAHATYDACTILDAAGVDVVLLETVGVGQVEVDVIGLVDSCVVVVVPGLGDEVQALKAGVLEIADLFILNKCDREGADLVERDLKSLISLDKKGKKIWSSPLIRCTATLGEGVFEAVNQLILHRDYLKSDSHDQAKKREIIRKILLRLCAEQIATEIYFRDKNAFDQILGKCANRDLDMYSGAKEINNLWRRFSKNLSNK